MPGCRHAFGTFPRGRNHWSRQGPLNYNFNTVIDFNGVKTLVASVSREDNKRVRRGKIFSVARSIIHSDGVEGLSLRGLAEQAGVTVPTLYNLIGSRGAILSALCEDALDELDKRLQDVGAQNSGLAQAEAIVVISVELFTSDPKTFRAVFEALEQLTSPRGTTPRAARALARCASLQVNACRTARANGDLCGTLDPRLLGEQILALYRMAMRRWVVREIDGPAFMQHALFGLFTCLLADASPRAASILRGRLKSIQKQLLQEPSTMRSVARSK